MYKFLLNSWGLYFTNSNPEGSWLFIKERNLPPGMIGFLRWFVFNWRSGNGVGCVGPLDIFVNGLFLCVSLPAIGRTLIPRYFSTVFEGGVTDLYYILKHSKESYHNSSITVDCDQCAMVTQHGKPMFTKVQDILSNLACSSVGVLKDNNYAFLQEL